MSKQLPPPRPERTGAPWWLLPLLVVLAVLGVIFLVRLVIGVIFASLGTLLIVALIAAGVLWFIRSKP
jgi:hypothetical protein